VFCLVNSFPNRKVKSRVRVVAEMELQESSEPLLSIYTVRTNPSVGSDDLIK